MSFSSQATCSCERGAAHHGWRRLSDVTRDDGQSQSRTWWWPGAGGREPIGRPGVTRIRFLVNVSHHSTALFLLHRPPRLENHSTVQEPTADSLSHHWDYLLSMYPDRDQSRGTLCCRPFGFPKHDRHEMSVVKRRTRRKRNSLRPVICGGWRGHIQWKDDGLMDGGGNMRQISKSCSVESSRPPILPKKEDILCLWITQPTVVVDV